MIALFRLIASPIGRIAFSLIGGLGIVAGLWLWFSSSFVSRAAYDAVADQLAAEQAARIERDAAAEDDARQATIDATRINELEEKVDAIEARDDDPVVWDRSDLDRLRGLRD